jgi:hypothetical protein
MVSNAREDLPLPLTPVNTTSLFLGIEISMFFRLCSRAPVTSINSSVAIGATTAFFVAIVLFPCCKDTNKQGVVLLSKKAECNGPVKPWQTAQVLLKKAANFTIEEMLGNKLR